jgi:putative phosphoesterase
MEPRTIGVISDTHGLVRPEAVRALARCELLIHAGDVGAPDVLRELETIAPLWVVRGNVDRGAWASALPERLVVELGGARILVLHDRAGAGDPAAAGVDVVVSGHSHRPHVERRGGVLWLNPGSAGPRRFRLPVAVARLELGAGAPTAEIIELEVDPSAGRC